MLQFSRLPLLFYSVQESISVNKDTPYKQDGQYFHSKITVTAFACLVGRDRFATLDPECKESPFDDDEEIGQSKVQLTSPHHPNPHSHLSQL